MHECSVIRPGADLNVEVCGRLVDSMRSGVLLFVLWVLSILVVDGVM